MVRIPDKAEHRRRWAASAMDERRRVMKAVNRGQALTDRGQALLAVGVARQQQRFWSRAWLLGPVISLLFVGQGWAAYLVNAAVSVLILGGMSWFWYRRASRAERANLDVVGIRPDAAGDPPDGATHPGSDGAGAGTPHAENPPKRSRAKRKRQ